ncbi:hypothetical protein [Mucilaginibacter ginsenosidivorax]|uniref:Uncharacterized protein n=1 Tax=Mucilaginibacter ginsenosidivorax TaxID=862126 RepID=A0A5B8VYT6_9SPHI|nr:hypothetical protein [Mucilaginibacter ginsenosidivorax]QEC76513.1 hypothetical protein FSB76_11350 [Mucilaginibacter ginsenosidivorax]
MKKLCIFMTPKHFIMANKPFSQNSDEPETNKIPKYRDKVLINDGGAVWFGLVIGWITAVTFYDGKSHDIKDLAVIISALGGAAITKIFSKTETQFSMYCVGMAFGFFIKVIFSH